MESSQLKPVLATIKIIHWAITIMPLVFGGVVVFINSTNPIASAEEANAIFMYLPVLIAIVAIPASGIIYKLQLKSITAEMDLKKKILAFQTAHIVRVSFLEAAGIAAAVFSLVTGTYINLGIVAVIFVLMALQSPTPYKIATSLNLTPEERQKLEP